MSGASFPHPEHITALRQKIEERIVQRGQKIEVMEQGLNRYKCQYRFGLRNRPEGDWIEIAIHFQIADRLETTGNDAELNRILEGFLDRHFG